MRAWVVVAITILLGCDPGVQIGARCALNSDCPESLACRQGRCRIACREARDCGPGLRCIASPDGPACTVAEEENCAGACTGMLACVERQCRSTCTDADDCVTDNCVAGFCEEPMSGVDASVPDVDAGVDGGGSCGELVLCGDGTVQGCDRGVRTELLRALVGTAEGEMHYLASRMLASSPTPTEGGEPLPPQLALALSATETTGFGTVAWIGGSSRTPIIYRFSLLDLASAQMLAVPPDVNTLRSLALGEDDELVYAFFLREPPMAPGIGAWLFGIADGAAIARLTDLGTGPVVQPGHGRLAFVGGDQRMLGTMLPFFGTNRELAGSVPVLSSVDGRSAPSTSYDSVPTDSFSSDPYLETSGGPGRLLLAWDGAGMAVWNVARPGSVLEHVAIAGGDHPAEGRPSIAPHLADGTATMIAVPYDGATRFYRIECGEATDCGAAAPSDAAASVASTTGETPTHVALARVVGGYAYGAIEPTAPAAGAATRMQLRFVDGAGHDVPVFDDVSMPVAPTLDPLELSAGDRMVDVQVAATRNSLGIAVFVAVLIRNDAAGTDRVWIGGLRACFAI